MKVLLQDPTGLYFAGPGRWTIDSDEAVEFRETSAAYTAARQQALQEGFLVFCLESGIEWIVVPLSKSNDTSR